MKKLALLFLLSFVVSLSVVISPAQAQQVNPPQAGITQHLDQLVGRWVASDAPKPAPEIELPKRDPNKVVYLTFDDGPDPRWTPKVIKLLQAYNARATFFVLGRNAMSYPQLVKDMALSGQTFGNHSFNHAHIAVYSYSDFRAEVDDTTEAVKEALQDTPELEQLVTPCLRPPYGEVSPSLYDNAASMGLSIAFWTLDTEDWKNPDPQEVIQSIIEKVEPQSIILMHDGGEKREATLKSLALILHELSQQGYSFLPMCTSAGLNEGIY
ncbi:MAG: polysaccharide deacetylase family protein [Anaerolineaceae bacterium]